MSSERKKEEKSTCCNKVAGWIEYRLPIFSFVTKVLGHPTPKNLNYAWNFGSMAGVALVLQILTGIFLAMNYTPHIDKAFSSIEYIMRDVNYGWLLRYMHAVGASMFFGVVYLHIFRGMYYGSFKYPRELLWLIGVLIFVIMMATAFMGYVLPWGQMSYWAATVITGLFSAIPVIGDTIVSWLIGGFAVGNPTLNRFFALHYLLPFCLLGVICFHMVALYRFGSNNPSGVEVQDEKKETIPLFPYYIIKDCITFGIFFVVMSAFVFYAPNYLGHPDNYIEANSMVTPAHIVPEWYFLPFYAILRSVPSKLGGVIAMFGAILVWAILPLLDTSNVKSGKYRPIFKKFFVLLFIDFVVLGWIGAHPVAEPYLSIGRFATFYYFLHFIVILPLLSKYENARAPKSISDSL